MVLGCAGATFAMASASAPAPAIVWGPAQPVSISSAAGMYPQVAAISCPAVGDCAAAGDYYNGALPGFVVDQTDGVWGTAQPISGLAPLTGGSSVTVNSVSCGSPGSCTVAGNVYAPYPTSGSGHLLRPFIVSETDGSWGTADILPPAVATSTFASGKMHSVSCSARGDCVAGGFDYSDSQTTSAEVVEQTNGTWGAPTELTGATAFDQVESVSCAAPGECVAGLGSVEKGDPAALATESGGTWSVQAVPGLSALAANLEYSTVDSVSCPAVGDCTAAGQFTSPADTNQLFVVTERNGSWGQASKLPQPATQVGGIIVTGNQIPLSCGAPGDCALASEGMIADEANGTWAGLDTSPGLPLAAGGSVLTAVSCPSAGNCSAGGYTGSGKQGTDAFVINEVNGVWGKAVRVPNTDSEAEVTALSCPAADRCVATGNAGTSELVGYVSEQVPVAPTATTISLSPRSVPYGREQAEKVTVRVSAAAGTPTGAVTVRSGSATVCTISLAGGHGSCTPGATRFGVGSVRLAASYAGPAWFAASASPAATFQVTRAGTKTALHLSAGTVKHGHENAELLTVRVTPQYAGTPAGSVTVAAGRTTVCVIRLGKGAGSCRLPASKLGTGTYRLVARYGGAAGFGGSASGAAVLRVVR